MDRIRLLGENVPERLHGRRRLPGVQGVRLLPRPLRCGLLTAILQAVVLGARALRQRHVLLLAGLRGVVLPTADMPHDVADGLPVLRPRRLPRGHVHL